MNFTESIIIKGLVKLDEYKQKVFPYIKAEFFSDTTNKLIFDIVHDYIAEYKECPPIEALVVSLNKRQISEEDYSEATTLIEEIHKADLSNFSLDWMVNETEAYCKDVALYNSIKQSVVIYEDKNKQNRLTIPDILREALSIDFTSTIGHDYFNDAEKQWDYYHNDDSKFPFTIDILNTITQGGVPNKTLNIFSGSINTGKSIWLVNQACDWLAKGKNVLFISMEMTEEAIRERIDVNLFDSEMGKIKHISKSDYLNNVESIKGRTQGKIYIKEYPAGQAHTNHFRFLLNELALKKGFKPDMIAIDYLTICASSKLSMSQAGNSNTYFSEVAKEFHAIAKEYDVPVWTAMQNGRSAQNASDVGLEDMALSIGVAATADFVINGISDEELEDDKEMLIKITKNRYGSKTDIRTFKVGLDRAKMKFFDIDKNTTQLMDDGTGAKPKFNTGDWA